MSFLSKLKSVFSPSNLTVVKGIVGTVYPIVELIATMTPTKADDEIISCANLIGVKDFILAGPGESGKMLKELAIKAAQKKMKNVPVEVIARAVESAYQQMKAKDSL
jgi:hypothetical protein